MMDLKIILVLFLLAELAAGIPVIADGNSDNNARNVTGIQNENSGTPFFAMEEVMREQNFKRTRHVASNAGKDLLFRANPFIEWNKNTINNARRDRKWNRATIPYEISSLYNSRERDVVLGAIREYQTKSCVKFVPRRNEADYIHITPDDGKGKSVSPYCYSWVGKMGGKQFVKMYDECVRLSAMIHELGHVIGFEHEHNRVDRDDHITILWDNIDSTYHYAYQKVSQREYDTLGLAYDYKSIMHYPDASFAKPGRKAFTLKRSGDLSRENQRLSSLDVAKIKKYYQC